MMTHCDSEQTLPLASFGEGIEKESSPFVGIWVGGDHASNASTHHSASSKRSNKGIPRSGRFSVRSSITMTDFEADYLNEQLSHWAEYNEEEVVAEACDADANSQQSNPRNRLRRMETIESADSSPALPLRRVSSSSDAILLVCGNMEQQKSNESQESLPKLPQRRESHFLPRTDDCQPFLPVRLKEKEGNNNKYLPQRFAKLVAFAAKEGRNDATPSPPTRRKAIPSSSWTNSSGLPKIPSRQNSWTSWST